MATKKPDGYVFGRPTKYRKDFCLKLIEHMKEGYSFESFGAIVDVCEDTLYEWANKHPNFSEAKKRGLAFARLWWERMGRSGMQGERLVKNPNTNEIERVPFKINTTIWVFSMKNRFKYHDNVIVVRPPKSDDEEIDGLTDEELIEAAKSSA
jgi:hypothetical protein